MKRIINIIICLILLSLAGCIFINPKTLDFGSDETTKTFTLTVIGDVEWSINYSESWITVEPDSGQATTPINVTVSRTGLEDGSYEAILSIAKNPNVPCPDVTVKMTVGEVTTTTTTPSTTTTSTTISPPDFITENKDYFITRIGQVPDIDEETYELKITGLVENPSSFTLEELRNLELIELPLTVECIGNPINGPRVSTAVWKGFRLYDLLDSLGLDKKATGVKYLSADGFYASHTLEQIQDNQVLGALFMNAEVIPPVQGFPLRILLPGFYGAKHPAWVTEIEVIDRPLEDYWQDRGWDLTPPMYVDSTIFFPENNTTVQNGVPLEIGGAAFGGTRISTIELTTDGGDSWQEAEIVESMDVDNVWLFWKTTVFFEKPGLYTVNSRATDMYGNVQPANDQFSSNGTNSWPSVTVNVVNVLSGNTFIE